MFGGRRGETEREGVCLLAEGRYGEKVALVVGEEIILKSKNG